MSTEQNKAVVRHFIEEVMNKRNLDAVDELYTADAIEHAPGVPPMDREGTKQFLTMLLTAFPDLHETIEDMLAEGDNST